MPVEISPTGHDDERSHQHILERPMPGRTAYAAVFDKIEHGSYTLWIHNEARARDVAIEGGSVTELDWSTPSRVERSLGPQRSDRRGDPDAIGESPRRC